MTSTRKTHLLRTTIVVLVVCGIIGLALTAALFFGNPDKTCASTSLQFTFEGAPDGLAPNGRAFGIAEIASDEVLTNALGEAGLEGAYSPEAIRVCLTAKGVYPEDMVDQVTSYASLLDFTTSRTAAVGDYHPTVFKVSLTSDFDKSISRAKLVELLQKILVSFRQHFAQVHTNGLDTGMMLFDLDQYDYPQQMVILQDHYGMMANYADEMYNWQPTFRWEGVGFNDISVRLNNLINSDIDRLNADLTMNALTKNNMRLLTQYQFEIRDLGNQLNEKNAHLEKLDALIDSYNKNEIIYVSNADQLTKIDGNSPETYDALVERRKGVADEITDLNAQIALYRLRLADLMGGDILQGTAPKAETAQETAQETTGEKTGETTGEYAAEGELEMMSDEELLKAAEQAEAQSKAQLAVLDKDLNTLLEKGQGIIDDFKAMLTAFNETQINELNLAASEVRYDAPKVLSGAFVKKAIMVAGPICALGFMACMLMIFISRKREMKV